MNPTFLGFRSEYRFGHRGSWDGHSRPQLHRLPWNQFGQAELFGTIRHPLSGEPLAGITLCQMAECTTTDDEGTYHLRRVPGGRPISLRIQERSLPIDLLYAAGQQIVVPKGLAHQHDIELHPAIGMDGQVQILSDGLHHQRMERIELSHHHKPYFYHSDIDPYDGYFYFDSLIPASYQIAVCSADACFPAGTIEIGADENWVADVAVRVILDHLPQATEAPGD